MNWHIQIGDHKLEPMSGMIYWFTYAGIEFDIRDFRRVLGMKPETLLDKKGDFCRSIQEKIRLFKSLENEPGHFMSLVKQADELTKGEAIERAKRFSRFKCSVCGEAGCNKLECFEDDLPF